MEFTEAGAGPSRASAVPSHMNGGVKPPAPMDTHQPGHDVSTIVTETSMRSIHAVSGDRGEVIADESFDAEFAEMEDVFFYEVDRPKPSESDQSVYCRKPWSLVHHQQAIEARSEPPLE